MKKPLGILVVALLASPAWAFPPIIDGTLDQPYYGGPLAVQDTPTGFGDSNLGQVDYANGSELDAAYGRVDGGNLFLTLTGNLESNFNKLEIFIDTGVPGQNQLRGDNNGVDFGGLNRMGAGGSGPGLKFDANFSPSWWIGVTGGGGPYTMYANAAQLLPGGGGPGDYLGSVGAASVGGALSGGNNFMNLAVTINNSNTGGVTGGSGSGGASVTTGLELALPLASIGNPSLPFKIAAFVNGGSHDYVSNQVLGGLGGLGNLGEPQTVDFSQIPGDQWFSVPEPATMSFLGLGVLVLIRRRR
ncbi:MAG TPA: PEP-CTERM sorting domain-containing protein [Phycisphaerae bacterium]|nr:PEP-CTERM sorting domain-containing protein [Phycisphaerae bacterium]